MTDSEIIESIKKQDYKAINEAVERNPRMVFRNVQIDEPKETLSITQWFILGAPEELIKSFLETVQKSFQADEKNKTFQEWLFAHNCDRESLIFNALALPYAKNIEIRKLYGNQSLKEHLNRIEKYCILKDQKEKVKVDGIAVGKALFHLISKPDVVEVLTNFLDWESVDITDNIPYSDILVYFFYKKFNLIEILGKQEKITLQGIFNHINASNFSVSSGTELLKKFWIKIFEYYKKSGTELVAFLSKNIKNNKNEDDELLIAIHYHFGHGIKEAPKNAALGYLRAFSLSFKLSKPKQNYYYYIIIMKMALHGLKLLQTKYPDDKFYQAIIIQCEVLENPSSNLPDFFSISPELSYSEGLLALGDKAIKAKKFGNAALWFCSALVSEYDIKIQVCAENLKNCIPNLDTKSDRSTLFSIWQRVTIAMAKITVEDKTTRVIIKNSEYLETYRDLLSALKDFLPVKFSMLVEKKNSTNFFGKDAIFFELNELVDQDTYAEKKYLPALLEMAKWIEEGYGVTANLPKAVDLYYEVVSFPSNANLSHEEVMLYGANKKSAQEALQRISKKCSASDSLAIKIQSYLNFSQASAPPPTAPPTRRNSLVELAATSPTPTNSPVSALNTNYNSFSNDQSSSSSKSSSSSNSDRDFDTEERSLMTEIPNQARQQVEGQLESDNNLTVTQGLANFGNMLQELQKYYDFFKTSTQDRQKLEQEMELLKQKVVTLEKEKETLQASLEKEKQQNHSLRGELHRSWTPSKWKPKNPKSESQISNAKKQESNNPKRKAEDRYDLAISKK